MNKAEAMIKAALAIAPQAKPKAIHRISCGLNCGSYIDFVERLAQMIASGAKFVRIPLPERSGGIYHENGGVIVREVVSYDPDANLNFSRYDAALEL